VVNKTNLRNAVEELFSVVRDRSSPDELVFVCPTPGCKDTSGNRSVNLRTGLTNCWLCGNGGPFYKWARRLGYQVEEGEAVMDLSEGLAAVEKQLAVAATHVPVYLSHVSLPKGSIPLGRHKEDPLVRAIARMAERKNLSLDDFIAAKARFAPTNDSWASYVIFPVTEWGIIAYYQGRLFFRSDERVSASTKKFPSRTVCPYGSRHWVYGIDELRGKEGVTCIIVESIFNVLSLRRELERQGRTGIVPVAIFKHKLSTEQAKKLASANNVKEYCLMYDSDATGEAWAAAKKQTYIQAEKFSVAEMPEGVDANDDAEEALVRYDRRVRFSSVKRVTVKRR